MNITNTSDRKLQSLKSYPSSKSLLRKTTRKIMGFSEWVEVVWNPTNRSKLKHEH